MIILPWLNLLGDRPEDKKFNFAFKAKSQKKNYFDDGHDDNDNDNIT